MKVVSFSFLKQLAQENPNDFNLGSKIRHMTNQDLPEGNPITLGKDGQLSLLDDPNFLSSTVSSDNPAPENKSKLEETEYTTSDLKSVDEDTASRLNLD